MSKTCNKCNQLKEDSEFYVQKNSPDGLRYSCKVCSRTRGLNYYYSNSDKFSERYKKMTSEQKIKRKVSSKIWYESNSDKVKANHYKKKFGISLEEYNEMYSSQGGVCAICSLKEDKQLAVDHDHITGKVRGLLCFRCNSSIGKFEDSSELLRKAANYLMR